MDSWCSHNGLARLIWRINRRISNGTAGRRQRCLDFQRQYNLKPARCQRITVSGRTIASASYILGNSRQTPRNISRSTEMKGSLLGRVRRSTLICCLKTRISASSATRDRSRSITIPKISLHKSNIEQQHRPILDQPPAGWGLRQGQVAPGLIKIAPSALNETKMPSKQRDCLCRSVTVGVLWHSAAGDRIRRIFPCGEQIWLIDSRRSGPAPSPRQGPPGLELRYRHIYQTHE